MPRHNGLTAMPQHNGFNSLYVRRLEPLRTHRAEVRGSIAPTEICGGAGTVVFWHGRLVRRAARQPSRARTLAGLPGTITPVRIPAAEEA